MTAKSRLFFVLLTISTLVIGCAGTGRHITHSNPSNPIRTIAILPMLNNTDDIEGPKRAREDFFKRLSNYHYVVKPLSETDEVLNLQMGITMGKQLALTTPQTLGETLGVDGVFYGYLLNFDEVTTGLYDAYKVRIGWKLINTKNGEIVWGRGVAVKRNQSVGGIGGAISTSSNIKDAISEDKVDPLPSSADPMKEMPGLGKWILMKSNSNGNGSIGTGIALSLGKKLVSSVRGAGLQTEMNFAYNKLFSDMLVGPGATATTDQK